MKKIFASIVLLAVCATSGFAQQEELKSATANIEKQDYIKALEDILKAKKKVSGLMTEQLAAVLPKTFGDFVMTDGESYGMGDGQGVHMRKTYRKPAEEKKTENQGGDEMKTMVMHMESQPEISVQITNNMMMANEVMNAHAMDKDNMGSSAEGMSAEAYRVKGYRALHKSYGGSDSGKSDNVGRQKMEEAHAIVGGAFVMVTARGFENEGQSKALLELIDFDQLIGILGK